STTGPGSCSAVPSPWTPATPRRPSWPSGCACSCGRTTRGATSTGPWRRWCAGGTPPTPGCGGGGWGGPRAARAGPGGGGRWAPPPGGAGGEVERLGGKDRQAGLACAHALVLEEQLQERVSRRNLLGRVKEVALRLLARDRADADGQARTLLALLRLEGEAGGAARALAELDALPPEAQSR